MIESIRHPTGFLVKKYSQQRHTEFAEFGVMLYPKTPYSASSAPPRCDLRRHELEREKAKWKNYF
jgi:hypothetical protein